MIIACPACSTRYVVPDSAVGVEGRTVRCAKCKHSWFQEGPGAQEVIASHEAAPAGRASQPPPAAAATAAPPPVRERHAAAHAQFEPETAGPAPVVDRPEEGFAEEDTGGFDGPPPVSETRPEPQPVPAIDPERSQFDYEPPFRPRRNPLKVWTAAAIVFATVCVGIVAAVSFVGMPDWMPLSRPTFAVEQPDLVLEFPPDRQDRRTLPNGTEFFGASGTITNVGRETRRVPPVLIVLRDARERIVYSWVVTPASQTLDPGESVAINEAVTEVPKSAKFAEIGWKPNP